MRDESFPVARDATITVIRKLFEDTPKRGVICVGRWFDRLKWIDGSEEAGLHGEFEWGWNQIQNSFATLLAAWSRGEAGYNRINYMAVGAGLVGWDTAAPAQPYAQTALTTESFRKAVTQPNIVFIDPVTNVPTGGTPSRKLEITVDLLSGEANSTLREFGLFGGLATGTANSGSMVNWIVHQRIDKDASLEIQRRVRLEFQIQ